VRHKGKGKVEPLRGELHKQLKAEPGGVGERGGEKSVREKRGWRGTSRGNLSQHKKAPHQREKKVTTRVRRRQLGPNARWEKRNRSLVAGET